VGGEVLGDTPTKKSEQENEWSIMDQKKSIYEIDSNHRTVAKMLYPANRVHILRLESKITEVSDWFECVL
jgi:hypothetical protein